MDYAKLEREIFLTVSIIREASEKIVQPDFGMVAPYKKNPGAKFEEIVSGADLKTSNFILKRLRKRFPGSYSEEHIGSDRFSQQVLWEIDPIDGTVEYCREMSNGYTINAALLEKTPRGDYAPIAGIIYLPEKRRALYGYAKKAVWAGKTGKESPATLKTNGLCCWVRKYDPNKKVIAYYRELGKRMGLATKMHYGGGSGTSFANLFEGKTNLVVMNYDYTKEWDIAMAEPIIKAAGGFLCDLEGEPFSYNRKFDEKREQPYNRNGYVASLTLDKEEVLSCMPKDLLIKRL